MRAQLVGCEERFFQPPTMIVEGLLGSRAPDSDPGPSWEKGLVRRRGGERHAKQ